MELIIHNTSQIYHVTTAIYNGTIVTVYSGNQFNRHELH
jgi:hypothetical protein